MDLWTLGDLEIPWSLRVVVTLRVPEQLAHDPMAIEVLAAAVNANADALARVLRRLAGAGVFDEPTPGVFALNEAARGLLEPGAQLAFNLDGFGGRMTGAWPTLLETVRTGRVSYHRAFARPFWDDLAAHPPLAAEFDSLMGIPGHGVPDPRVLLHDSDWDAVRWVVDVGGGTGALLTEICNTRTSLRGTLIDLPTTVARAALPPNAESIGQSFFDPLPSGADLYILKNVLADWPDEDAVRLLRRCAEAAQTSNGRVVVYLSEETNPGLLMLVLVGGRERTLEDFRPLATEAGLRIVNSGSLPGGKFVAECQYGIQ